MSAKPAILILKFPYSSTFGGGEKHTITLVEKLQEQFDFYLLSTCTVLLPEFQKRNWNAKKIWAGTEPVTPLALLKFCFTWFFILINLLRYLLKYKREYHIQTIFCLSLTEKILLTPFAKLLGLKVIWMEHLQIENWLLRSPLRLKYVWWSRWATIVTVVQAVKTQLIHLGVNNNNVQVIYNGIDPKQFASIQSTQLNIKEKFEVLFVGRLAKEKGVDDLIHAINLLKARVPQIHLTIVGAGPFQAQLESSYTAAAPADKQLITFTGFQTDTIPYLQNCNVFVLPSTRRETFGYAAVEALASAKPVVVANTGGLPEVIGKNQTYGYLVEPHQPQQIADALYYIYTHYSEAIRKAQAGREFVLDNFTESKMLASYAKILYNTGHAIPTT